MAALMSYGFPGNIRELENLIERAFILCSDREVQLECLPAHVAESMEGSRRRGGVAVDLTGMEMEAIRAALERHGGNRTLAARQLGIHRTTLLRKMKRNGMQEPAFAARLRLNQLRTHGRLNPRSIPRLFVASRGCYPKGSGGRLNSHREAHGEAGAAAWCRIHVQGSSVLQDHLMGNEEPEPRALETLR